jgi:hypothetical protein
MKELAWVIAAVAVLALTHPDRAGATEHFSKSISVLEVNNNSSCYFFQLEGVTQADPAVSGPWFAIPKSFANAKEMYALLLSVRASGGTLNRVLTGGSVACSGAEVVTIDF